MQRLEVSGAVRPIYGSLGFKRLIMRAGVAEASRGLCFRLSGLAIGSCLGSQRDGFLGTGQTSITGFNVDVNNIP